MIPIGVAMHTLDEPKTVATIASEAPASSPLGQLSLQMDTPAAQSAVAQPSASATPKPRISKRTRNAGAKVVDAVEARRDEKQTLAFTPEDFIRFGLPYKRHPGIEYERRNGGVRYRILASPEHGIPFGQDRLLPIWLATAYTIVGKPEDGVIRFQCVKDILRAFGLGTGGSKHAALTASIQRLMHATFFVYDERQLASVPDAERKAGHRYNIIDGYVLWFDRNSKQPNQHTLWQNEIILSRAFAASLREKVMPLDLDTVRALKDKPMALDLYVWQAHRSWELHQQRRDSVGVPVFGERGLLAQLGSRAGTEKKARELLRANQKLVQAVWRGCPNHLTKDGNRLVLRPAEPLKDARLSLPGVSSRPPVPRNLSLLDSDGTSASRLSARRQPADEEPENTQTPQRS